MNKKYQTILPFFFLILLIFIPQVSKADWSSPSHSCSKPYKPHSFRSQSDIDQFKYAVERYKTCIKGFINEQNNAAKYHQQAAEQAVEEWNNFVNWELRQR